jgi:predicted branched-subunit amino acid permease
MVATLPLAPGVVAFGLLYGLMARQVGLSPWEAGIFSISGGKARHVEPFPFSP